MFDSNVQIDIKETVFSVHEIREAIKALKSGKACGPDFLTAEHFKYAHESLYVLLSLCFTSMMIHCYLPDKLMENILIPVLKDKCGNVCDKSNYRPIALTNVSSKIIELCILSRYDNLLHTSDNQFGYKEKHSTDLCIFAFKQIISYYRKRNSPIFICFLDASKAFDKVNHSVLWKKLISKGIPLFIVKFLAFWYSHQTFCVRWGDTLSHSFLVTNGVRQGGILSPKLFNVYIDALCVKLTNSKIGCNFNGTFINNLAYADDMTVIAPCASALQKLLNICDDFARRHDISYNVKKSVCMCIPTRKYKYSFQPPKFFLNNVKLQYVENYRYLGCHIDKDFTDNIDLKRQLRSIYTRSNMLLRKFYMCSIEVKCILYRSYCTNFYCSQL